MTTAPPRRLNPTEFPTGSRHENILELELPGVLPFAMERLYRTGEGFFGPLGMDQLCPADLTIRDGEDGQYQFTDMSGIPVTLVPPEAKPGAQSVNPARKDLILEPLPRSGFRIRNHNLMHDFALMPGRIWRLMSTEDHLGRRIMFERDGQGLLTQIHLASGLVMDFQNDAATGLRLGYDLIGRDDSRLTVMRYAYDAMGRLTLAENHMGPSQRYRYDDAARSVVTTDDEGHVTTHVFDDAGRVVQVDTGGGYHHGLVEYHDDRRQITVSHGDGTVFEKLWFDDQDRHFMTANAHGGFSYRAFTDQNDLASETDPNGHVTRYRTDPFGNPEAIIDPEGRETFMVWDDLGQIRLRKSPAGDAWRYTYDDRGLLSAATDPMGHMTEFRYDANGQMTTTMRHDGLIEFWEYDDYGRLVSLTDFNSGQTRFTFDAFDRPTEITDPAGGTTKLRYVHQKGQGFLTPSHIERADGVEVCRTFTEAGQVATLTDGEGRLTAYHYGPYAVLERIVDPRGNTLNLSYNSQMQLTCVTNQLGLNWTFERDAVGWVTRETDFDGRSLSYHHDDAGRVIRRDNPDGSWLEYDYDKSGLLLELRAFSDPKTDPLITTYAYDDNGALITAKNAAAEIALDRDALGRIVRETVNGTTIENTYSCCGDRIERRIADQCTRFTYDGMGNLTEWALDGHAPLTLANDPLGNETARQTATGFGLQQSWDAAGQLTQQTGPGIARAYDWSRAYEPTRIKDDRWGEKRYDYDQNGQISRTRHGDGGEERFSYGPDLNLSGSGDLEQFTTWQTSAAGVVRMARGPRGEGVALEHDVCGRVIKRTITRNGFRPQVWTFEWNAMDQMIAAHCPDGRVWHYAYDPFGRRVWKETPGARHDFLWDGDVIARETVNGHAVDWFFEPASFRPLARLENGALAYVVNDHLGTPKEVISERGALLWAADHDTWGSLRPKMLANGTTNAEDDFWLTLSDDSVRAQPDWHPNPTFCPIRFQGQWEDTETGLYQNRFRYYDPVSGQYSSRDPIGIFGGWRSQGYVDRPVCEFDADGLVKAMMVGDTLCLLNKYSPGTSQHDEMNAFVELWDEETRRVGGFTRQTVTPDMEAAADSFRTRARNEMRRCCPALQSHTAAGHTPDVAWGGTPDPGDAWVPLDRRVNSYIGGLSQAIPVGTSYSSVRTVTNMSDC